jgi:anti-sigma regulatory factor (Ser/Thr protein kinase)
MRFEIRLPAVPTSVPEARQAVRDTVSAWGPGVDLDALQLALGELVANAVRYTDGDVTVSVEWAGNSIAVGVADQAPDLEPQVIDLRDDAETGRGLHIVGSVADEWGTYRDGASKTAWFRVPADATADMPSRPR